MGAGFGGWNLRGVWGDLVRSGGAEHRSAGGALDTQKHREIFMGNDEKGENQLMFRAE